MTRPTRRNSESSSRCSRTSLARSPQRFIKPAKGLKGVTEETTTGVHRLYQRQANGQLLFPAINVNDSVTKSKFDNVYGCRQSLVDGIRRATDLMLAGKVAVVCGFGDVGKGCAESLRGEDARVNVTEIDPICALQAACRATRSAAGERRRRGRHLHHGDRRPGRDHGRSHGCDEAPGDRRQHRPLRRRDPDGGARAGHGIERIKIKPQVDKWRFPDGHSIIVLSEGRVLNFGNATGHPSFVMSNSFTNQMIAQIELFGKADAYGKEVHVLPKHLDEKVARLHLDALGVELTELNPEQAADIGVPIEGPTRATTTGIRPAGSVHHGLSGLGMGDDCSG